jgi:hypothetical protein
LFFLPHWGSFGALEIVRVEGRANVWPVSGARQVRERRSAALHEVRRCRPGERTYLDIQYLTIGSRTTSGASPLRSIWL